MSKCPYFGWYCDPLACDHFQDFEAENRARDWSDLPKSRCLCNDRTLSRNMHLSNSIYQLSLLWPAILRRQAHATNVMACYPATARPVNKEVACYPATASPERTEYFASQSAMTFNTGGHMYETPLMIKSS